MVAIDSFRRIEFAAIGVYELVSHGMDSVPHRTSTVRCFRGGAYGTSGGEGVAVLVVAFR
jgi:hypothetical protein